MAGSKTINSRLIKGNFINQLIFFKQYKMRIGQYENPIKSLPKEFKKHPRLKYLIKE